MIPLNTQPIEKQTLREDGAIEVVNVFWTIQGEGPWAGRPAVFVRLAGCNLDCPDCDTDYTRRRRWITPTLLVNEINLLLHTVDYRGRKKPMVVFTGGEPFRQDFGDCVRELIANEFNLVQVESNGTLYVENFPYLAVYVVCSPKTGAINPHMLGNINCYKYVVEAGEISETDGLPVTTMSRTNAVARPPANFTGAIYLQPLDTKDKALNRENEKACVAACQKFGYTMSYQLHKVLELE